MKTYLLLVVLLVAFLIYANRPEAPEGAYQGVPLSVGNYNPQQTKPGFIDE